jgi:hypothetical protein
MKMATSILVNIVLSTILLSSILYVGVTASVSEYDPWYDINDDGKIDIKDVAGVAIKYGTTGTPLNKTEILLDLQARVEALENASGWLPAPAYDSGWIALDVGWQTTLLHGLYAEPLFVFVMGRYQDVHGTWHYTRAKIGTDFFRTGADFEVGIYTEWTNQSVSIYRGATDPYYDEVRVQIWKIKES